MQGGIHLANQKRKREHRFRQIEEKKLNGRQLSFMQ